MRITPSTGVVATLLAFFWTTAPAQKPYSSFHLKGVVADSATHVSIGFATVTLRTDKASVAKVSAAHEGGIFVFSGVLPQRYRVEVTSTGYGKKTVDVNLSDTTVPAIILDTIFLVAQPRVLDAIKITAERPLVRQEIDHIAYDLQIDPDSRSSNLLDIMRKVPFLSVDGGGNVLLKGSGNYRIFINGRPSGMLANNPKEVLRAMPAWTVRRIEVITNPPAKYDAEGLAGIINIVLEKRLSDGYNGNVNVNELFPLGGPGAGGSLSILVKKVGISAYAGANRNTVPTTMTLLTRNNFAVPTTLSQEGIVRSHTETAYAGSEISYEMDSLNLLTASINVYSNLSKGVNVQQSIFTRTSEVLEAFRFHNEYRTSGNGADGSLNLQRGFRRNKNRLLTFSYGFRNSGTAQFNDVPISDRFRYEEPDYQQRNEGRTSEQTVQVDLVQGMKSGSMEAGAKAIFRTNKSDYQHFLRESLTGRYELAPDLSNAFRNTQNVFSLYSSYTLTRKQWSFKAGVRVEQTVIDAVFASTATNVHQNYLHVIPSVGAAYKLNGKSSFNLGFSRRIKQPNIYKLNPFVDRSNPSVESYGNPSLRPSLVNTVVLGYGTTQKLNLNIGVGYSFFTGLDFRVSEYNAQRNTIQNTFKNIGKGYAYNMDVTLNRSFAKRWNASVNSSLAFITADGENAGAILSIDRFIYNLSCSGAYRENGWRLQTSVNIAGPNLVSLQSVSNGLVSTGFSLSKEAVNGRLSLLATVNNPFRKYRSNKTSTAAVDFFESNVIREYFRSFGLGVNLRFGNLKEGIKKNKRGISNTDLTGKGGL